MDSRSEIDRPLERVLVATDFSPPAEHALEHAIAIAREHGASLQIFHAFRVKTPASPPPDEIIDPRELEDDQRRAAQANLDACVEIARREGITVQGGLESGFAAERILAVAHLQPVDLIVTGSRGQDGLARFLLGSVAARIVREAECPVWVVHPGDSPPFQKAGRLLIPTDFSDDVLAAASTALRLFSKRRAELEIVLLHVSRLPSMLLPGVSSLNRVARGVAADLDRTPLENQAVLLRVLGFDVTCLSEGGSAADTILRCAKDVDWIAMGTRGRSGLARQLLGSTAAQVIQRAGCPVLVRRKIRPLAVSAKA